MESSISLADNTLPTDDQGQPAIADRPSSRRLSRKNLARKIHGIRHRSGGGETMSTASSHESSQPLLQVDTRTANVGEAAGASKSPQSTRVEAASPSAEQRDQENSIRTPAQQKSSRPTSEIDILYENQRGWFIFGVPLYSDQTLLQFDPGAWVTAEGKDSLVNITDAQVPDPSWEWAWKTWYVDMSGDVDEQGWQYSFSFRSHAWHGSHPWFHCFVRRRRWLRLRVQRTMKDARRRSKFERAHMLGDDYFTIHSSAARGYRQPSVGRVSATASAYSSTASGNRGNDSDLLELDEISDIPMLMYALHGAIVDRVKLDYLKKFVEQGGEELYYLKDKVRSSLSLSLRVYLSVFG